MRRDGGSVLPAHANTGDPNGPFEAGPLIRPHRADIHDGSEHNTLQSEAGYIDARPHVRQIDETLLQRTAGPYIGSFSSDRPAPDAPGMSASLRSRPNLRTAANRRDVPIAGSCAATNDVHRVSPFDPPRRR